MSGNPNDEIVNKVELQDFGRIEDHNEYLGTRGKSTLIFVLYNILMSIDFCIHMAKIL